MSLQGLTTILPPPRRADSGEFIGKAQETYDRRAAFRRASDTFVQDRTRGLQERFTDNAFRGRRADDAAEQPAQSRTGRRATDQAATAGLHLKLPGLPEFVRHSTPFVAQAIGQEHGVIDQTSARRAETGAAAAYDAGVARVDSFFSVVEPIEVYA